MRNSSCLFVVGLVFLSFGAAAPAAAQVSVNVRTGSPFGYGYYRPRPYYGPRYYYPPVAPVPYYAPLPPPPPVVIAPYYAPRPYYYGPRRGWRGGRRW